MRPLPTRLLPDSAEVVDGVLHIGGCNTLELAQEFGTPVFVYDEQHLRDRCRRRSRHSATVSPTPRRRFCAGRWPASPMRKACTSTSQPVANSMLRSTPGFRPSGSCCTATTSRSPSFDGDRGRHRSHRRRQFRRTRSSRHAVRRDRYRPEGPPAAHARDQSRDPRLHLHGPGRLQIRLHRLHRCRRAAIERAQMSPAVEVLGIHAHIGSQVFAVGSLGKAAGVIGEIATATTSPRCRSEGDSACPMSTMRPPRQSASGARSSATPAPLPASPPRSSPNPVVQSPLRPP